MAQVAYHNSVRFPAHVAEGAIVIVGPGLDPEKKFEEVVLLPEYQPGRFVFILTESLRYLDANILQSLLGIIVLQPGGYLTSDSTMNIEEVRSLYTDPIQPVPAIVDVEQHAEHITIELDAPVGQEHFIFVSQQYFSDWHAMDDNGNSLALFKVGGGLTGTFIHPGTQVIQMSYQLPNFERIGRWVSLAVLVVLIVTMISAKVEIRKKA